MSKIFAYIIVIGCLTSCTALVLSAFCQFAWALALAACSGLGVQFAATMWNQLPATKKLRWAMLIVFVAIIGTELVNGVQASSLAHLPGDDVSLVRINGESFQNLTNGSLVCLGSATNVHLDPGHSHGAQT